VIVEPTARSDAALVTGSRDRPEEFAALFDRYSAMLYRYVSRRLGPDVSEDLVGETFLVAFQQRHRYDESYADARPWLFGIATKLMHRHRRSEAARFRALRSGSRELPDEGPAERVLAGVTAESARPALARALACLSRADRDTLLLVAWADLSYEEAAAALGIPEGTVASRLSRARRKVRAALGGIDPTKEHENG
jgi:RNA polymerase sigma-70 factor (ECF subfamily)